jgi:phosphatidylglycerophosphatase A
MNMQKLFLGFLGTGQMPRPGIMASLLALIIALPLLQLLGMETLFMLTFVITIISLFEVNKYVAKYPESDGEEITIDDAAGMWLSLMVTLPTALTLNTPYGLWVGVVTAFVSFTLFQTWKPSTIGWMHRTLKGGLGIVLSSVLSGLAGGLLSVVILMGIAKLF